MVCIYCKNNTDVYNSRVKARTPSVWRRRRCTVCVAQFTTTELPDYQTSLVVEGLSNKLYPFSRDKLFLSLHNALGHRKDALNSSTALTDTIIGKVLRDKKTHDGLIKIESLAATAHITLKRYDPLAAHTYKAYHKNSL